MSYLDSAQGITITQKRALKELAKHGLDLPCAHAEFFADMGNHSTYQAYAVLEWLGY